MVVRTVLTLSTRQAAEAKSMRLRDCYLELAAQAVDGARTVRVPAMAGIDENMREWSIFMILEHNAIVNRSITSIVVSLARGEQPSGLGAINPKTDVMPSPAAGSAQLEAFCSSVDEHVTAVRALKKLRGTRTWPHPVFGDFDAHKWNSMFAFHLGLHLPQARYVAEIK